MHKYRFWIVLTILIILGVAVTLHWGFFGIIVFSIVYGLVMNLIPDEK